VGEPPKTAWVIGYPLLERIYYLLVAGYDVWGNTPHQLQTRLYMDFLRMEGEANFLMLLPRDQREALRNHWYRGATPDVTERVLGSNRFTAKPALPTSRVMRNRSCYRMLQRHLAPVLPTRFDLQREPDAALRQACSNWPACAATACVVARGRAAARGRATARAHPGPALLHVLRNTGHFNVATLLRESAALAPSEQTLTVVPGFIGAYPNALMHSTVAELPALARARGHTGIAKPTTARWPTATPSAAPTPVLGRQRCADAGLPAMGTGRGRLAGLRAAAEPLSGWTAPGSLRAWRHRCG
jgi:hypothetical protein